MTSPARAREHLMWDNFINHPPVITTSIVGIKYVHQSHGWFEYDILMSTWLWESGLPPIHHGQIWPRRSPAAQVQRSAMSAMVRRPNPGNHGFHKGYHPLLWPWFRLVNYNLPRFIKDDQSRTTWLHKELWRQASKRYGCSFFRSCEYLWRMSPFLAVRCREAPTVTVRRGS